MDLNTVNRVIPARSRADLGELGEGAVPLAGGSVLFAEPNPSIHTLIDLQTLDWEPFAVTDDGLEVAATTTLTQLSTLPDDRGWRAYPLFYQCCTALFGSFKVWNVATVGGNICTALPAGPMTSLFSALDAEALIWKADGSDVRIPVSELVTGNTTTSLNSGDVLRSLHVPARSLGSATAYRKIALSAIGRSGAVVIGRFDPVDESFVLTVSAATVRPEQLRFAGLPTASELRTAIEGIGSWFTDAHGAADWRLAVSVVLGEEIRLELTEAAR
ncbi:CO or xanthine dehydrogenase, FAD-binding subunit [Agreia bicolorata]|uniref:CO or xanthine dehydrogenase, FAD-binding subunit n=1 Tax=Agreia bicolorata TaxID=110935 RepID=A0A1T4YG80_9MICO|nr:FAD binding domain-containing protein [Agreia bicolorata]SKB00832.1 CO or xanthine dehydrogenase, FAD-binding subunit [Agreia bicolorata]